MIAAPCSKPLLKVYARQLSESLFGKILTQLCRCPDTEYHLLPVIISTLKTHKHLKDTGFKGKV